MSLSMRPLRSHVSPERYGLPSGRRQRHVEARWINWSRTPLYIAVMMSLMLLFAVAFLGGLPSHATRPGRKGISEAERRVLSEVEGGRRSIQSRTEDLQGEVHVLRTAVNSSSPLISARVVPTLANEVPKQAKAEDIVNVPSEVGETLERVEATPQSPSTTSAVLKQKFSLGADATSSERPTNNSTQPSLNSSSRVDLIHGSWRHSWEAMRRAEKNWPGAVVLSESSPYLVRLPSFTTEEERKHLIAAATVRLQRSKVVAEGEKATTSSRTSSGAWLTREYRDEVVRRVEERLYKVLDIPSEFAEGLHVLRYEPDQRYEPHMDSCARQGVIQKPECVDFLRRARGPACGEGAGGATCGDRLVTAIMILWSPEEGGETLFPKASKTREMLAAQGHTYMPFAMMCRLKDGLKVFPVPGDALVFWNYVPRPDLKDEQLANVERRGSHQDGSAVTECVEDPAALHGGCPVIKGEKWIATKWFRSTQTL